MNDAFYVILNMINDKETFDSARRTCKLFHLILKKSKIRDKFATNYWDWFRLSVNPNITLDMIQENHDKFATNHWDWPRLSFNNRMSEINQDDSDYESSSDTFDE